MREKTSKYDSSLVKFKRIMIQSIDSTPQIIVGSERNICLVDNIILTNLMDNTIQVSVYVLYEEKGLRSPMQHILYKNIDVPAHVPFDLLSYEGLVLKAGDILIASSTHQLSLFNSYVSYRELTQVRRMQKKLKTKRREDQMKKSLS